MIFQIEAELGTETQHKAVIASDPFTAHLTVELRGLGKTIGKHPSAWSRPRFQHGHSPTFAGEVKSRR